MHTSGDTYQRLLCVEPQDEILSGIPRGEDDNITPNGLRIFLPAHGGICEGVREGLASVVARLHTSLPLACPTSTVLVLPRAIAWSVLFSMLSRCSLPPSKYVDETGTTKNDPMRQAFNDALGGRQNVKSMAHSQSLESRDSACNNLHRVWDEHMSAKNPNPKTQRRPTHNICGFQEGPQEEGLEC